MLPLLPLLPFVGAAVASLSRGLSVAGATRSACGFTALAFGLALLLAWETLFRGALVATPTLGLASGGAPLLELGLVLTPAGAGLAVAVTLVSLGVHLYSLWYRAGDPNTGGFFALISLFTGMMLVAATGGSLLTLFLGWEGIGVVSYLLVAYWSTRRAAATSAMQAFLLNRAGDIALTLALALALGVYGGASFAGLALPAGGTGGLALLLLVAAAGKSAQLGLHAWLPNAMEAPTPVSALIHAATLVTAGVFLLVQCHPVLAGTHLTAVAALLGAATTLFAGVVGLGQNDLKRVIAFSTCSQIALVLLAVGTGQFSSGIALLLLHASYKAALFLGAGRVIHGLAGVQDLRAMGGLGAAIPFAAGAMLVAGAALCALPFTSGEFGKDLLVVGVAGRGLLLANALWWLAVASVGLTGAYSVRLHRLAFEGAPRASLHTLLGAPEAGLGVGFLGGAAAVALLAGLGLLAGYGLSGTLQAFGGLLPGGTPWTRALDDELSASGWTSLAPLLLCLAGGALGYAGASTGVASRAGVLGVASAGAGVYRAALRVAGWTGTLLDRGLFEAAGPYGASSLSAGLAVRLSGSALGGGASRAVALALLAALAGGALVAGVLAF